MSNIVSQSQNSLSIIESVDINSVQTTLAKINQFQTIVQGTLKVNHDYGIIPGTTKPTLLKPGAEKIHMLFGVTGEYEVVERIQDYDKGFFAFTVRCYVLKNGLKITEGLGHCNTKEKKYINQDPYTLANTCLKMAKKRAQIDATLTLASLSEIFTQDIEDMKEYLETEQIETMTPEDAGKKKLTFGKHKGKTLKEIFKEDKQYLEWVKNNDRTDPIIKKAVEIMFDAVKNQATKSDPQPAQEEASEAVDFEGEEISISDEDIPFK
ncbi:hypothetical protein [Alkalihalobacterium alkalinitrilicum]|uniref:exodeoxyribonuclease X C-terminal domain-containing protein n=1 Tax=Alkalihalobacterium alkalinitrilicum TaxID=427920 RepID=UPI00099582FD|nr:hypothetical protein [Alkalihalobacterium alkalinitrilicum]